MGFISDVFRRRKLRPIIRQLPHILTRRYGKSPFYTAEQVNSVGAFLRLDAGQRPYAFAVACSADEFRRAEPDSAEQDYMARRTELARLFAIALSDLNCRFLTQAFRPSGVENSSEPSILVDTHHGSGD
jgi:hypothetical protein